MENFIFPVRLEKELKKFIDFPEDMPNILCFYGLPANGKTSFAEYMANKLANNFYYLESQDVPYLKDFIESVVMRSICIDEPKEFINCFIIDEFHNFNYEQQNKFNILFDYINDEHRVRDRRDMIILCINTTDKKPVEKTLSEAMSSRCDLVRFDILMSEKNYIIEKTIEKFPELDPAIIKRSFPDWRVLNRALKMK
jgi:replication-associated recombination protein RarA